MVNTNIPSDSTLENIKRMAPKLTRKQQHIVFGMLLGFMTQNEPTKSKQIDKKGE